MSEDTVFHKIVRGEIPADVVFEDEQCLVFRDINPVAPVHLLCVPKQFVPDLASASESEEVVLGHLLHVASHVAQSEGIEDSGYRIVINSGPDSGQEVPYLHVHVIGGKKLGDIA